MEQRFVVLTGRELCKGPFETIEAAEDYSSESCNGYNVFGVNRIIGVTEDWEVFGTADPPGHRVIFGCSCKSGRHLPDRIEFCWGPFLTRDSIYAGLNRLQTIYGNKQHYVMQWVNEPQAVYAD